ncbi:VanZ family protein [Microbacterium sp. 77mftsu3.1]|uniref:VanZ family protein n=1 Tax=Microbacterium sp. 77mftsu3.1 TaxID=1761802 RepID=UPI00037FA2B6|nr:VanZ family protein [Microbacterium sp. 77mftsu3.1]SDG72002.1 VanZ like family protein [Microbacterium sp. 77mftsu3.1]
MPDAVPPPQIPPKPPLPPKHRRASTTAPVLVLAGYVLVLAVIAFWPTPVDAGVAPVIDALSRRLPAITRPRVEFAANVALFVPFGVLLPLILRGAKELVLPIALVATVTIECTQALVLQARVPSVLDIVANVTGASVGMLGLAVWQRVRRR